MMKSEAATDSDFINFMGLLEHYEVEYVLVGGQAMATHGFTRHTEDIDILCKGDLETAKRLIEVLAHIPESGVDKDTHPSIIAHKPNEDHDVVRVNANFTIDIMYQSSGMSFEDVLATSVLLPAKSGARLTVRLASLETLLAMKKDSLRPKDQLDVLSLQKAIASLLEDDVSLQLGGPGT